MLHVPESGSGDYLGPLMRMYTYLCACMYIYMCIYIYIHVERERERERERDGRREGERERESAVLCCPSCSDEGVQGEGVEDFGVEGQGIYSRCAAILTWTEYGTTSQLSQLLGSLDTVYVEMVLEA